MKNKTIVKLALSTAMVGFTALGGASVVASNTTTEIAAPAQSKKAHGWAKKAERLFAKGRTDKALGYAEAAVGADLTNVEYRNLLARIYMAQGRFNSAERTFADVMELGQVDARTVVGVALSRIAQGKADSAIALVDAHRSLLPASDYGLALALAGDSKRSVDVLVEAIRGDNASARTRQNLALAYALDGRWREARIMAVQDMPQDRVDTRIAEWAQYARPGAYQTRIAGLLKVTPREDAGQPVRLTSLEYRLLHYLLMHAGRVVSRTELTEHLYDQDFDRDSNTMEVIIGRLRRKIGAERIITQRGLGYRLDAMPGPA